MKADREKTGLSSKTGGVPYDLSTLYGDGWDKEDNQAVTEKPPKAEEENTENKVIDVDGTLSDDVFRHEKTKRESYLSKTPYLAQKLHGMSVGACDCIHNSIFFVSLSLLTLKPNPQYRTLSLEALC